MQTPNKSEMKKTILPMPKCLDKECINGVVTQRSGQQVIQKICAKCERMERDLLESEDYDVFIINGRAVGYELVDKT